MTDLTVVTRGIRTGALLALAGELDYHTAPEAREALAAITVTSGQQLIIDLSGLTFCDSSGIATFIAARNHALAAGADIALTGVPDRVARILHIVGLDRVLVTYPTIQAAAEAHSPQ
ncbi:STAS domain-containing protein [Actinomadura scrupuli]|uniref:STAS domain-containing protein n=1 Tax=Actinomadura scrupuli TaxID=559629 RepID=UPI003D9951B4